MIHARCLSVVFAAIALLGASGTAFSQTTITRWNFNGSSAGDAYRNPSTGSGTLTLLGGITASQVSGSGSSDGGSCLNTTNYPAQGTASGTAGVQFAVDTTGYTAIRVTFDERHSSTASRFTQFLVSADGGFSFSPASVVTTTLSGSFINARTFDLSSFTTINNTPQFVFKLVSIFDPAGLPPSVYAATMSGSTYATGGTIRYDAVTIAGMPIAPIPPSGTAAAPPVCLGNTTLITVTPISGQNPPSNSYTVSANLSAIGNSPNQQFFDDGTNGDAVAGDGVFSYAATVPLDSTPGLRTVQFSVTDDGNRTGTVSLGIPVGNCSINSSSNLVIREVYGGGGGGSSVYNADFVEIYNRSDATVSMDGLSLQYAPASGTAGFGSGSGIVLLAGNITAGQNMLVKMSPEGTVGAPLPRPDFIAPAAFAGMSATSGRVALCNATVPIGNDCADSTILDLVGYGAVTCFEGVAPAPLLDAATAAIRKQSGAQDSNQNFNDFEPGAPLPQNSGNSFPPVLASAAVAPATVCTGAISTITVQVTPGINPDGTSSTISSVTADLTALGGTATQALFDDGTNGDLIALDSVYSLAHTVAAGTLPAVYPINLIATDSAQLTGVATVSLAVGACQPANSSVVISQIYGGGGNAGAPLNADFVELHNRTDSGVQLAGYSIQYASANGSQGFGTADGLVVLGGCIGPGEFRLIRMSPVGTTGLDLPAVDFTAPAPFEGIGATGGRVALVSTLTPIESCTDVTILDLVGFGTATCFEGAGPAPATDNTTGVIRTLAGNADTNENFNDFEATTPDPRNATTIIRPCGTPSCPADFNNDGVLNADDLADFITGYFDTPAEPRTDFNGDGVINADDLADYITAYFNGCS